jgi:uncharacterized protein (TIGR03067 family)
MPMFRYLMLASVGLLTASAVLAGEDANVKDIEALRGTWKVVELTEKGEKIAAKELEPVEVVILGTKMTINDEGKFREEIALKIDAAKKPKTVDLRYTKGPNADKVEPGIYEIDGDTLKICSCEKKGGDRPKDFTSTKENECSVVLLKRVKQ